MKICLVSSPLPFDRSPDVRRWLYLPLGLLTLTTLLEQAGHEVTIVDPNWEVHVGTLDASALHDPGQVVECIQVHNPHLVGFSTICSSYPRVLQLARRYRGLFPDTPLLLGGPQATVTDVETLRAFPWVDMVLRGEAESSIVPLVDCLERGGDLAAVPGLTWRQGERVQRNPDAPLIVDLDTLPRPAYHLYPTAEFSGAKGWTNVHLEAGRGCPFNCTFCSTSPFFRRRYRSKSPERLIREMRELHTRYGVKSFDLVHDLFICNKEYVQAVCRDLRKEGLHETFEWRCNSRIDTVDEETLREMAAAGCYEIYFGVETGSTRMQRLTKKGLKLERVKPVVSTVLSHGMRATISFICGFPQETEGDLRQTLALILDLIQMGAQHVQLYVLTPFIGSDLYRPHRHTLRYDGYFSDFSFSDLTPEEQRMVQHHPDIFASFYHFESPHLNRHSLYALSAAVDGCPHLLVALREEGVDVFSTFCRWSDMHQHYLYDEILYRYGRSLEFNRVFYRFLRDTLAGDGTTTPDIADLIEFHIRSLDAAQVVIGKLVTDGEFRRIFFAEPDKALSGYDLTEDEIAALKAIPTKSLETFAGTLDEHISKARIWK